MSEISDFEKQLNPGKSFDTHLKRLTFQLAERLDRENIEKFLDQWNAWVLDLPSDVLDLQLLGDVEFKYLLRSDLPADDLPDYTYLAQAGSIYAAAAQRAYNRAEYGLAWDLLVEAKRLFNKVSGIDNDLFRLKQKADKITRAVENGDVPGQRVRYQIITLLHRAQDRQKQQLQFSSVKSAIEKIDDDIARFIDCHKLQISHVKLVATVRGWIRDHPAFRAEIAPFFAVKVIKD